MRVLKHFLKVIHFRNHYNYSYSLNKFPDVFRVHQLHVFWLCKKVKWSRYRPGVAQRVGRDIALLFHDRGTGRGWVVSSTLRPNFTRGKNPVPIVHEAGWLPGSVWTGGKSRRHRDSIPDRPARNQSLTKLTDLLLLCNIYVIITL